MRERYDFVQLLGPVFRQHAACSPPVPDGYQSGMVASSAPVVGAEHRILPERPITSLARYEEAGGGAGLFGAMAVEREVVLSELESSGLRGRGGAGFPTGTKWRTILSFASEVLPTTVVVNAAEGEPGTYKDRLLLERNPYAVSASWPRLMIASIGWSLTIASNHRLR